MFISNNIKTILWYISQYIYKIIKIWYIDMILKFKIIKNQNEFNSRYLKEIFGVKKYDFSQFIVSMK